MTRGAGSAVTYENSTPCCGHTRVDSAHLNMTISRNVIHIRKERTSTKTWFWFSLKSNHLQKVLESVNSIFFCCRLNKYLTQKTFIYLHTHFMVYIEIFFFCKNVTYLLAVRLFICWHRYRVSLSEEKLEYGGVFLYTELYNSESSSVLFT